MGADFRSSEGGLSGNPVVTMQRYWKCKASGTRQVAVSGLVMAELE